MSRLCVLIILMSVGYMLSTALANAPNLSPGNTYFITTLILVMLWFIGFTIGARTRADEMHHSNELPYLLPLRSSLVTAIETIIGSFIFSFLFVMIIGISVGKLSGISILRSSLWAFLGTIFNPILTFLLFIPMTMVIVQRCKRIPNPRRDGWILITAASQQGMWLFSGLSVLILYGVSRLIGGSTLYGSAWSIVASASLSQGVFSTGYASGHINRQGSKGPGTLIIKRR